MTAGGAGPINFGPCRPLVSVHLLVHLVSDKKICTQTHCIGWSSRFSVARGFGIVRKFLPIAKIQIFMHIADGADDLIPHARN